MRLLPRALFLKLYIHPFPESLPKNAQGNCPMQTMPSEKMEERGHSLEEGTLFPASSTSKNQRLDVDSYLGTRQVGTEWEEHESLDSEDHVCASFPSPPYTWDSWNFKLTSLLGDIFSPRFSNVGWCFSLQCSTVCEYYCLIVRVCFSASGSSTIWLEQVLIFGGLIWWECLSHSHSKSYPEMVAGAGCLRS